MEKSLESILFESVHGAIAFFDSEGLLIRTNDAWETMWGSMEDCTLILTYDDLVEQLELDPMNRSEMMHVTRTIMGKQSLFIRRRRIEQERCSGIMVEVEDISSTTQKIEHVNRLFSDVMWKIRSRISSVQNVLTLFTDYQNEMFDSDSLHLLKNTRREVWEMMRHMENLRYFSSVDIGTVNLKPYFSDYLLKELINGVCIDCSPLVSTIDGEVTTTCNIENDQRIFTDRRIFMKVISVLLFNGIRYNSDKIDIVIKAEDVGDRILVSVTDNGWGIPDNEQKKVFSYGFRGSTVQKSNYSGAGVELYLARKLLMMINGSIHFVSREQAGSTFTLSFRKPEHDQV